MTILFLIGNEIPVEAVNDWNKIKTYKDKGFATPSKAFYFLIKALEKNPEFKREILLSRKNIGIASEGIDWEDYYFNYYLKSLTTYSLEDSAPLSEFFFKVKAEVARIKKTIILDEHINSQLNNLVIGNFVFPDDFPITFRVVPEDEFPPQEVSIVIDHKVTENELITYLQENWKTFEKLIHPLPPSPNYFISERDHRIIELKDIEKLSYHQIAEKIISEFNINDLEGKINSISVARAYNRAKKKVSSIVQASKNDK